MQEKKELFLTIEENEIYPNGEIHGRIELNYNGRFDTLVINSHIENSSDICNYIELNGKKINHPYSRLSLYKKDLEEKRIINFIDRYRLPKYYSSNAIIHQKNAFDLSLFLRMNPCSILYL